MATTVTYKGATLTTVNNETKVLETAGTWVEDDFTLVDVTAGGISVDDLATNSAPSGAITLTATTIGEQAFSNKPITTINAPDVLTVNPGAFRKSGLTSLYLPNAKAVNNYVNNLCESCTSLETVVLPSWDNALYTSCFDGCTSLQAVDIKGGSITGNYVFRKCTPLNVLILRNTSVVSLSNTAHFNDTPFASGKAGGTLYVPNALKSSYQSASNWSTIIGYTNNSIEAIEGSYYETHYADGTVIS